ncbi:MAG: 3-deoxy-manno-octulosonate cytidylyltransferase, partial [Bacteroidia bacterium]|nr:3-deoxy-manno-octulosonate cytidylyltransferase [Bacteroidia bacterium]
VYRQCEQSKLLNNILVATDDQRIQEEVHFFRGNCIMTSPNHISGTDRVAEACLPFENDDIIINIQGDEPTINPKQIDQLIEKLKEPNVKIGTLARSLQSDEDIRDPNLVKVVKDDQDRALYFSRSVIPYNRNESQVPYFGHVGMYGFMNATLQEITQLPPGQLEISESLEQLRWLEHGYSIHIIETVYDNIGVDTPEDLEKVKLLLKSIEH